VVLQHVAHDARLLIIAAAPFDATVSAFVI
jgi:hypothetical protein